MLGGETLRFLDPVTTSIHRRGIDGQIMEYCGTNLSCYTLVELC